MSRTRIVHDAFEHIETYVDDVHFSRSLVRCKRCGQHYLKEFYETVDWVDSNDPQFLTWLPVENAEEAEKINRSNPEGIPYVWPQLKSDWPKDGEKKIYWIGRE